MEAIHRLHLSGEEVLDGADLGEGRQLGVLFLELTLKVCDLDVEIARFGVDRGSVSHGLVILFGVDIRIL